MAYSHHQQPKYKKSVFYENIHPSSSTYQNIANMITNKSIVIDNVVRINNPVLKKEFYSRKYKKQSQGPVKVHHLFHGTKKENVNSICTYNFDWSLCKKHKYGKGVYFTHNAKYASNYCDEGYHKVLVLAKVLIGKICVGQKNMEHIPNGYDTSQRDDSTIIVVKNNSQELLPAYKVYFHFDDDDQENDSNDDGSQSESDSESDEDFDSDSEEYSEDSDEYEEESEDYDSDEDSEEYSEDEDSDDYEDEDSQDYEEDSEDYDENY